LEDSVSGSLGEPKSADSESLRKVQKSDIVGDSANNGYDSGVEFGFAFGYGSAVAGEVLDNSGEGDGVAIKSGLVESFVDDLVELGIGSALKEGVKLGEESGTLMRDLR
jgi:hypothetical protein